MKFVFCALIAVAVAQSIPGGWTNQDPKDPQYADMAWKAAPQINKMLNKSGNALIPVQVVGAKTQVVAGMNTEITVQLVESSCSANGQLTSSSCQPNANATPKRYRITIWEQPWMKKFQVTDVSAV